MTAAYRVLRYGSDAALTLGLVLVLFATYLLWWTNHAAHAQARREVHRLEQQWAHRDHGPADDGGAETAEAGTGGATGRPASGRRTPLARSSFAVLRIPRLGLSAPIAEGVDKRRVLDRGFVGHYPGTALPGQEGNFALAAHRNAHGKPFRHLDRMRPGDVVTVTTAEGDFRYRIDSILPQTSPADTATIARIPTTSSGHPTGAVGYGRPGRYITLTTCTPEFTSRYRMVVWGHLMPGR
ncbi:class E sortase [Streptomyces sp. NPDC046984]|uniref:class E sortase n=1 Tax=unclassified Streptomyces TaxID=2593676 RepID=UPI0033D483EB